MLICWQLLSSVSLPLACIIVMNSICCHLQTFLWGCFIIVEIIHVLGVFFYVILCIPSGPGCTLLYRKQHIFTIDPAANMLASVLLLSVHGLCYHISPTPLLRLLTKVTEGVQLGFHPSKHGRGVWFHTAELHSSFEDISVYKLQPKSDKFLVFFPINGEKERA